jgi:hypothetical protein
MERPGIDTEPPRYKKKWTAMKEKGIAGSKDREIQKEIQNSSKWNREREN